MSFISEFVRVITRKPPVSIDTDRINLIEEYLVKGDLSSGIDAIDSFMDEIKATNIFAKNYLLVLKSHFLAELQQLDDANECLTNLDLNIPHPVIETAYPIEIANIHRLKSEFTEALDYLEKSDELIDSLSLVYPLFYKLLRIRLNIVKAKIFNKTGKFDKSTHLLETALSLLDQLGRVKLKAEPLNDLGITYASIGDSENGLYYMNESLMIYQESGNDRQALKLNNNLGLFNYNLNMHDPALEYFEKALTLSNKLNTKQYNGPILMNMGLIYQDQGDISNSLKNFEEALAIFEEMDIKQYVAQAQINMGNIYQMIGELDTSLKLYKSSQIILEELDDKNVLASLYNSMASLYSEKGLKPKAVQLIQKSIALAEEIENYSFLPHALTQAIDILLDMENLDESTKILEKYESHLPKIESNLGEQLYNLSKARVLLKSERVVKQAEAQSILTELAENASIPIQYALSAYLKLAELLLQEMKISPSEAALGEFKDMVSRLSKLTESGSNSVLTPTKISVLILRSKLALIDLELEHAQEILTEAYDLAKTSGLKEQAKLVKGEQDAIKDQMMKYKQMVDTNASLYERLQESQIENYLKKAENILKR